MNNTYKIVSLYCFSRISEKKLLNFRDKIEKFEEKGLTGLVILAKEGINGTISARSQKELSSALNFIKLSLIHI